MRVRVLVCVDLDSTGFFGRFRLALPSAMDGTDG
jgi:hypothetical protein